MAAIVVAEPDFVPYRFVSFKAVDIVNGICKMVHAWYDEKETTIGDIVENLNEEINIVLEYNYSKCRHSNDKYRKTIWQCVNKFDKGKEKCSTPHFSEEQLKDIFVKAFNELFNHKGEVLESLQMEIDVITDTTEIKKEISAFESELEVITGLIHKHIEDNATNALDQEVYKDRYNRMKARYDGIKDKIDKLVLECENRKAKRVNIDRFMAELKT